MRPEREGDPDRQIQPDSDVWRRAMELFDLLLEHAEPEALLASWPDAEAREAAARLWRDHLEATREAFLEGVVEFSVPPVFTPGQVLLDRFAVDKLLGRGGMGEVYLARDRKLGDAVALKTIARLLVPSGQIRRRFIAEVQNARRVTHPNVCRIHELFDEGDTPFFVMEYVNGSPLGEMLATGTVTSAEKREIAAQLAEGLHAAHRGGVVHGDFKPGNVLVVRGAPIRAVIMDFGLARALRSVRGELGEDALGAGTLEYMAPELLTGSPPSVSSDIFAFGKVAGSLVPGARLWAACTREHPGERPTSLAAVIAKLRRDPTRRYWLGGAAVLVAAPIYGLWWKSGALEARLEAGARILVNGFEAAEQAVSGARIARALLITGLQQSPILRPIGDQDLVPALRALAPGRAFPVDAEVLRRLVTAQRATHWIDGVLRNANGRASLALRLWRSSDWRLHAETTIGDAPALPTLSERAAVWVRRMAGESWRSLETNSAAVSTYTSSSPEALQKYYDAMSRYSLGQMELAIPLLEEALHLDPNFAQARHARAMCWSSARRHVEAIEEAERARKLAVNLPPRERAWLEATYQQMTRDPVKMVEAARVNMDYHSDEPRYYRVYGQALCLAGRPADSVQFFQKAMELAPENDLLRNELALALSESGEFDQALEVARVTVARSRMPEIGRGFGQALVGLGRYEEAYAAFERVPEDARLLQAGARVLSGDAESAEVALELECSAQRDGHDPGAAHRAREFLCGVCFLTDRVEQGVVHLRQTLPLPECPAFAQALQTTAFWAARLGDDATLAATAAQMERIAGRWVNGFTRAVSLHAQALAAWRRRDTQTAELRLFDSLGASLTICALFDLADFFAATGRSNLAEEYWRKFENRQGTVLRRHFPGIYLFASLNRGLAAQTRGDRGVASVCANRILRHWGRRQPGTRMAQRARELIV